MVGVVDLREVESLSKLSALALHKCCSDAIYINLDLPSKLTWYTLRLGREADNERLPKGRYDKNIALEVTGTAPLVDWICHMLKESELVHSIGKGSINMLTELQLNEFQNVKDLSLSKCDLVTHLLKTTYEVIKFPNLYNLDLACLECLTHFCSATIEGIEFPRLHNMYLGGLPELQTF
ncbi:hypothetical protein MTR67_001749 [Solanum verrucosum]|uniref:Uncharacterized protein n=1 Tax=Solanum verrucosum TaxID=315347 RepID=A0AAF0T847_SOLVR|nr:hypothetical protein MTR67_001749 [Solanum verrucosum]